jgi:hypothetical protein
VDGTEKICQHLAHYEKVLEIRCRQLGENNIDLLLPPSMLVRAYTNSWSVRPRKLYHASCVKFSKSHRDIAVVLSGIAQIHAKKKGVQTGFEFYEGNWHGTAALGVSFRGVRAYSGTALVNSTLSAALDARTKALQEGSCREAAAGESTHPEHYRDA